MVDLWTTWLPWLRPSKRLLLDYVINLRNNKALEEIVSKSTLLCGDRTQENA
jgi:hypothetical protein